MVQIDWSIAQNALAQPDPGQRFQMGFQQGAQQRKEREMDGALNALAANPDDPKAQAAYMRHDPRGALQFRQQRATFQQQRAKEQQAKQERDAKTIALAVKNARDPQAWDAVVDEVVAMGYPDAAEFKGRFSPEARAAIMAAGGIEDDKEPQGPASVQEYEYAKQQGFDGTYMDFLESKRGPIVANNGDGTFTIIPRGAVPGGGAAPAAPPPPPGFVLDGDEGGQTPPASGTFQP